jgi:hypothetical protein
LGGASFGMGWACSEVKVGVGCKGVVAGSQHTLGQVFVVGMSGDGMVPQHGVGFPATKELDDVAVDTSTEQGRGPARLEAAWSEEEGVDACLGLKLRGCDAEGRGDVSWVSESGAGRSPTVVGIDGCVDGGQVCWPYMYGNAVQQYRRLPSGTGGYPEPGVRYLYPQYPIVLTIQ